MGTLIKQSFFSGLLIGLGVVINTLSENPYIGSLVFSLGLLTIIECNLKLYTGKIGFIKDIPVNELIIMLIVNCIGVLVPSFISIYKPNYLEKVITIAENKFSYSEWELFLFGTMCGVCMFIAVYCRKPYITVLCIMMFILSGYEHCIAAFPFLIFDFSLANLFKFLCIVFGNSIGSIISHWLMKTC